MTGRGAEISLIPPKPSGRLLPNPDFMLQAINRSNMKTNFQLFTRFTLASEGYSDDFS